MNIKTDSYEIWYEPDTFTINFQGSLRLSGMEEYDPIVNLLDRVIRENPSVITLNLKKLDFLNSSGISMLSKFVINVRKLQTTQIMIKGSQSIPWQGKSLKNLQRLMPNLELTLD